MRNFEKLSIFYRIMRRWVNIFSSQEFSHIIWFPFFNTNLKYICYDELKHHVMHQTSPLLLERFKSFDKEKKLYFHCRHPDARLQRESVGLQWDVHGVFNSTPMMMISSCRLIYQANLFSHIAVVCVYI